MLRKYGNLEIEREGLKKSVPISSHFAELFFILDFVQEVFHYPNFVVGVVSLDKVEIFFHTTV